MANLYTTSADIKTDILKPYRRQGAFPIDQSSLFTSLEDAQKYAKNLAGDADSRNLMSTAYVGQILSVVATKTLDDGTEKTIASAYIIIDEDGTLSELASAESVGSASDAIETLQSTIDTLSGDADTPGSIANSVATGVTEAKGYTDELVGELPEVDDISKPIADENGVEPGDTGWIPTYEKKTPTIAETLADIKSDIDAAQQDIDDLETLVGTLPSDTEATTVVEYAKELADAVAGDLSTVEGKVNTLIGSDADKSVRTIANEELVKQLIPETAQESLDTLEEIAAWIQQHPEDAAEMNKRILELESTVGKKAKIKEYTDGTDTITVEAYNDLSETDKAAYTPVYSEETGLVKKVSVLEEEVGKVDDKISDAIDALDADEVGGEGKYIKSISEENGVITAETGNTSEFATAAQGVKADSAIQGVKLTRTVPDGVDENGNLQYKTDEFAFEKDENNVIDLASTTWILYGGSADVTPTTGE